ncbi:MBL fold metallo-hydrolase, partial [Candidatus Micrarchaeota archaeon]|nr:MBL fold metallo-hydrolase [Candidatus Micrarchaeota archaeon]
DEPTCFGFKLTVDRITVGYTSDTELYSGMEKNYQGCDYLTLNCLRPSDSGIPDHLKTEDIIKILKVAKPRMAILSHLGLQMLKIGPEKQAELIEKESGVKCIAAKDGQILKSSE